MNKSHPSLFSALAIVLLVFIQVLWVSQVINRDKSKLYSDLTETLQSILAFNLSKSVSNSLGNLEFAMRPYELDTIPKDAVIKGSFNTNEYSDTNIGHFLVGVFAGDLLKKNEIPLEPIDSLFIAEFPHYNEIYSYNMIIQNKDSVMRYITMEGSNNKSVKNKRNSYEVIIPIGESGTYLFTANVFFKPSVYTQRLLSMSIVSGIIIILISVLLLYQLSQLRKKTSELDSHKKAVRGLVHDLKTPLSYTFTLLDSFENTESDLNAKKKLYSAKTRINHISKKIEVLLSTLKHKTNRLMITPLIFNLTQCCTDILEELKVVYRAKNINYTINPVNDVHINVDPFLFEACLRNILDNAVKYSENIVEIIISITLSSNSVSITVADNGKGISSEHHKKIFKEFYHTDNNTSLKNHGIGLAFSKQVVEAHSGEILVESIVGKGSKFTIIIPQHN